MPERKYLSVAHASARWDVATRTVYDWIKAGEFRREELTRLGPDRRIRIDVEAYERRAGRPKGRPRQLERSPRGTS